MKPAWLATMVLLFLCGPVFAAGEERLAMHFGKPHQGNRHELHHGMGGLGKGICPQSRTAPTAPEAQRDRKNPVASTPEALQAGESLFHYQAEPTACKVCHGSTGNGLGLMAQGKGAMPRNFQCLETMREISDGQMFYVIRNGSNGTGMPAFKNLTDQQIWQLIHYLRTFADSHP